MFLFTAEGAIIVTIELFVYMRILPEDEIYADFAKIYRAKMDDYFFGVAEELVGLDCT